MIANKLSLKTRATMPCSLTRTPGARKAIVRPAVASKAVDSPPDFSNVPVQIIQTVQEPAQTPVPQVDADVLNKKLEAKAKALIALEEQEYHTRPKVRISLQRELALGEAWKVVGKVPELGRFVPEVAPYMTWNPGHVWTYEGRMRPGTWVYKLVLHKPDGAIVWEEGPDRELRVTEDLGADDVIDIKIDAVRLPSH